jgi:hypothetical protein
LFFFSLKHSEEGNITFVIAAPPHKKAKKKVKPVAITIAFLSPTPPQKKAMEKIVATTFFFFATPP